MSSRLLAGDTVLERLGDELDELHDATCAPVTARRPWLQTWIECYQHLRPVAIVVERGTPHQLVGAALLAVRRRAVGTEIVAVGHGPSDQTRLPVRDADAADELVDAIVHHLGVMPGPWRVRLAQLPVDDAVARRLAERLPAALIVSGASSPTTRFREDRALRSYVSRNHHQQVRRMINRMERDGLRPRTEAHRDPARIGALMPEVERVCRERDRQLGRRSKLDDPHAGPFFRSVVTEAAARGELELVTLELDGRLAAYVISFLDDGVYRMWNCRFDPEFERYGVGRVANDHALGRALADGGAREFDWMKGEEAYKASMATDVVPAIELLAWSSPHVRLLTDAPRRAKVVVKPYIQSHERVRRLVDVVRRT